MSGFIHEWRACSMIAKQGVVKRNKQGINVASWLLLLIAGVCAASAGLWPSNWRAVTAVVAVPLFVLALLWWTYIHSAIVEQNRCSAGRLVPGQLRRSLLTVFGLFAAMTLLFAALFWPYFGASLTPLAVIMILLSTVAAAALTPVLTVLLSIVFLFFGLFPDVVMTALSSAVTGPSGATVLLPLAVVITLSWIYLEIQGLGRRPGTPAAAHTAAGPGARAAAMFAHVASLPARRYVPAALLEKGAIAELMLLANGRVRSIAGGVLWTFIPSCILAVRGTIPLALLCYITALLQIAMAFSMRSRLDERPVEQALARLSPRAPETAHFNAVLVRALLKRYLRGWALTSVLAIVVGYGITGSLEMVSVALILFAFTLPAASMFLRSRARPPGHLGKLGFVAWLVSLFVLPYQMTGHLPAAQAAITVLMLSAGGAALWLAQRHLPQFPIAFPSTRLA